MTTDVTNALEVLVGEGKKFATAEELAKGKLEADTFVKVLEQQIVDLKGLTETLQQKADRTEALEKLMSELDNKNSNVDANGNPIVAKPEDKGNQPQTLTQEDIVKLIEQREAAKAAERNLAEVKAKLKQVYGDKTDEAYAAKAGKLGLTIEQLDALGRSSPAALLNLVGETKQTSTTSATSGGKSGESALTGADAGGEVRNRNYYNKMKADIGAKKFIFDMNIQKQLHRDMMELGDEFFAT